MPQQISPSDLALFRKAEASLVAAQSTMQFVQAHLGDTYQLTPQDRVDLATGQITRPESKAKEPRPKASPRNDHSK